MANRQESALGDHCHRCVTKGNWRCNYQQGTNNPCNFCAAANTLCHSGKHTIEQFARMQNRPVPPYPGRQPTDPSPEPGKKKPSARQIQRSTAWRQNHQQRGQQAQQAFNGNNIPTIFGVGGNAAQAAFAPSINPSFDATAFLQALTTYNNTMARPPQPPLAGLFPPPPPVQPAGFGQQPTYGQQYGGYGLPPLPSPSLPSQQPHAYGQPLPPPFGQPHGPTSNQPHGPTYDRPYGSTCDQPYGLTYDQPYGPTYDQPFGQAYDQPDYNRRYAEQDVHRDSRRAQRRDRVAEDEYFRINWLSSDATTPPRRSRQDRSFQINRPRPDPEPRRPSIPLYQPPRSRQPGTLARYGDHPDRRSRSPANRSYNQVDSSRASSRTPYGDDYRERSPDPRFADGVNNARRGQQQRQSEVNHWFERVPVRLGDVERPTRGLVAGPPNQQLLPEPPRGRQLDHPFVNDGRFISPDDDQRNNSDFRDAAENMTPGSDDFDRDRDPSPEPGFVSAGINITPEGSPVRSARHSGGAGY